MPEPRFPMSDWPKDVVQPRLGRACFVEGLRIGMCHLGRSHPAVELFRRDEAQLDRFIA
jgi:hypothetical protein